MTHAALRCLAVIVGILCFATPALTDLSAVLANADPGRDERVSRKCAACHTVRQSGEKMVGFNLYGIVGGPVATMGDCKYSTALTSYGGESTAERLIAFLNGFSDNPLVFDATEEAEEEYEFGVLFNAPGVETTYYICSACHSELLVAQQGLTRDGWTELLEWMVDEQGMSDIEEPEYSEILDYLSTHYGEDRTNFPNPQHN